VVSTGTLSLLVLAILMAWEVLCLLHFGIDDGTVPCLAVCQGWAGGPRSDMQTLVSAAGVGSASRKADWSDGLSVSSWLRPSRPAVSSY
jgi:hypothetical protein